MIMIMIIIWFAIGYTMLWNVPIDENWNIIQTLGVFCIFIIGAPIFLLNDILLMCLGLFTGEEWEDDT